MQHSTNYDENLSKLEKSGQIVIETDEIDKVKDDKNFKKLNNSEKTIMQKLMDSEIRIQVHEINEEEFFKELCLEIKQRYGKKS